MECAILKHEEEYSYLGMDIILEQDEREILVTMSREVSRRNREVTTPATLKLFNVRGSAESLSN